ncbi:uncharacterized protein DDB_G0290685-like isoform X1 [Anastrepha ludens]|uniref:uncharacterized protein DDB_G0290685-like isoform X1 n=2 Tax=Anastrepha ludens TaxID=28586 RepID=UPI0023AEA20B|nr:uncharacterized protein DDB_G0290685-like isoform X1 [Anastrepha ludens]
MVVNLNAVNNLPLSSTSSCTDYFFDGCHSKNQNNCQSQYQDCQCRPCCVNSMINDHTYSLLKKICRKVIRDYHRQQTREKYTIFDGGNSINVRIHRSSFEPGEDGKCKPILGDQSLSRQNDGKDRSRKKDKTNGRIKNKVDDDDDGNGAKTNGWKRKARKSDLNFIADSSGVRKDKKKSGKGEDDVNKRQGKGKDKGGDDNDSGKRKGSQVRGMRDGDNDSGKRKGSQVRGMRDGDNDGSSKRGKGRKEKRKGEDQDDDSSVKQGKRKGSEDDDNGKVKLAKGKGGKVGQGGGGNDQDEDVAAIRNTRTKGENIQNADNKRNRDKEGKVKSSNNRKDGGDRNDDTFDYKVDNKKSEKGKRRSSEANDDGKHGKGNLDKSGAKRLENGETNDKIKSDKANRKNYKQSITDLPVISDLRTKVRKGHDILPNRSFQEDGRKTGDRHRVSVQISKRQQKQLSKSRKGHINERFGSRSSRQKFRSSRSVGGLYRGYGSGMPSRYDEIRPCDILRAHMEQRELCEIPRCCLPCPCNCNTIYCQAPSIICSGLY